MKSTKRSMLVSGLCLLLTAVMLMGSTFAWFTDSVTNEGNVITAGNLSIDAFAYGVGTGGTTVTIEGVNGSQPITFEKDGQNLKTDTTPILDGEIDWEPGMSNAKLLTVTNTGSLAAKLKLQFDVHQDGLEDALWFDFVRVDGNGNLQGKFEKRPMSQLSSLADSMEFKLAANGGTVSFVLVYGMYEEAENEYQGKTFSAGVTILATQAPVEADGFGNTDYDKDVVYPALPGGVNTVIETTVQSEVQQTVLADEASGVSAVIPGYTLADGQRVKLTVVRTAVSAEAATYEINFTVDGELRDQPFANPIAVKLNLGQDFMDVGVKHNGVPMTESDSGADQTFQYDSTTGVLTLVSASFSPFEVSYKIPEPVATVGGVGYASLAAAVNAAEAGDTITLIGDVVVDETLAYSDPWNDPGMAGIPQLRNITIDGAGHTISAPENGYLFGDVRNSVIKNVTLELRGSGATYFTWNVTFENVITTGEAYFNGGNEGAFVTYAYDGELVLKNCVNRAELASGGAWGNYNAVFVGYPVAKTAVLTFDHCVNEGSLICGTAAMFVANPHYTAFTMNITDCANNGLIQATYPADGKYTPNLLTAVTNDGTNTLMTVNADGKTYKGVKGDTSVYNVPVGGNGVINGPKDDTLAISLNEDGTFTVTPAATEGVDHYVVSYGVYSTLVTGGSSQVTMQEVLESGATLTTQMKNCKFVDETWVNNNPNAVESQWNGYTLYTLEGETYYLLPAENLSSVTLHGIPTPGSQCAVSAYDADGKLVASAQLHF